MIYIIELIKIELSNSNGLMMFNIEDAHHRGIMTLNYLDYPINLIPQRIDSRLKYFTSYIILLFGGR